MSTHTPSKADLNEDWLKTRRKGWDIRRPNWEPATRSAHLRDEMQWPAGTIEHFLTLPAALGAPDSLLQDLAAEGLTRARDILDERAARGQTDDDPSTWGTPDFEALGFV